MPRKLTEKLFYNTVLCQTVSPSGNHLVAGNIYGDVSVFDISKTLEPHQTDENDLHGPAYHFNAYPDQQLQSMVTTNDFLVTGTCGEISGWDWKVVTSNKVSKIKPSWNIQIPTKKDSYEKADVNYMVYSKSERLLYAGCGDNKIYVIHLEDGKILRTFTGHTDYIHCLAISGTQLASASEDGSVRLWDLRKKENASVLQPHTVPKVDRPTYGKWIGTVDFTEDWLLCGGGPSLSLWHMRSMEAATVFNLPDQGIHVGKLHEERIIVGGVMPNVYHLTYQEEILTIVPTSGNTTYSIVYQETPQKFLSIAGTSNNIDLCVNFNYRELVLRFV